MGKKAKPKSNARSLNLDLFAVAQVVPPPAPATLHTRIAAELVRQREQVQLQTAAKPMGDPLPSVGELYRMFDELNFQYWDGKLPRVQIVYSNRMSCAGSYTPSQKLMRIGRKYHELFPEDLEDTVKHEMIHIINIRHDGAFRREAKRVGASLKARPHPSLRRPPKYVYECPSCRKEYPRQKRFRMASCGTCSGGRYNEMFKLALKKSAAKV